MKAAPSPRKGKEGHSSAGGGSPASAAVGVPLGAVVIDGSQLEGGGQILRNGVAVAAISRRPVYIHNIRAGRRSPGLSPQHLTGLQLVAAISRGQLQGGAERSSCISFVPGEAAAAAGSSFTADTRTAGSCTLMVQQALPCLLFAPTAVLAQPQAGEAAETAAAGAAADSDRYGSAASAVVLKGGTDAAFAPPIGYLQHVLLPTLQRLLHLPAAAGRWDEHAGPAAAAAAGVAAPLCLELKRRGFYPKGGGEALLQVPTLLPGCSLPSWDLTSRGRLVRIDAIAFTAGAKMRSDVGQRMAAACSSALKKVLHDPAVVLGGPATAAAAAAGRSRLDMPSSAEHHQAGGRQQQHEGGSSLHKLPSAVLDIQVLHEPPERAVGEGGGIVLVATTSTGCRLGSSSLAARGVTAEAVGAAAAEELIEALVSGAAVDQWMQDQLIVFMALASGTSSMLCSDLTLHTRTAIAVAQQMLPGAAFTVAAWPAAAAGSAAADERGAGCAANDGQQQQQLCLVRCKGVGLVGR